MYASSARAVWNDLNERFDKIDGSRSYNLHKKKLSLLVKELHLYLHIFQNIKICGKNLKPWFLLLGVDCPKSRDFVVHLQKLKLFQFLMGLDDSYSQATNQILLMSLMPRVNQAYDMVINDESQKSVAANAGLLGANSTSVTGQYDVAMYTKTRGNFQKSRKNFKLFCNFCKMKGHCKENCYKIVGYPLEYRPRRKSANTHGAYNMLSEISMQNNQLPRGNWTENNLQNFQLTSNTVSTTNSQNIGQVNNASWLGNCTFTKEQYDHIVQLLNKDNSASSPATPLANAAGIPCALLASNSLQELIIDTGATNHMVADIELLNKASLVQTSQPKKKLFSGRVKAIGREDSGLYILSRQTIPGSDAISLATKDTEANKEISSGDIDLWHKRLGHISTTVLKKLLPVKTQDISARIDLYCLAQLLTTKVHMKDCIAENQHYNILKGVLHDFNLGFAAICIAALLSLKTSTGSLVSTPTSFRNPTSHMSSATVDARLLYSASAELLETVRKYALEPIFETGLADAKPIVIPLDVNMKLTTTEYDEQLRRTKPTALLDEELSYSTPYQRLIGKLLYLTMTRLEISFNVQTLTQFLQKPKKSHMKVALRIVKYIKNNPGQGRLLSSKSNNTISAYCDADWAACPIYIL
ncbi:uncharacterized protein [Nicotiana tomentosiformis]|uniref:uncharacterized protein n=1 Tax=Nicotiana tomentosiformis TaxID=4098 RepID=UPI00388C43D4